MAKIKHLNYRIEATNSKFAQVMSDSKKRMQDLNSAARESSNVMDKLATSMDSVQQRVDRLSTSSARMARNMALSFAGLALAMLKLADAASEDEESLNKMYTVFGRLAPEIDKWTKDLSNTFQRSRTEIRQFVTDSQALLDPLLMNAEAAAEMSQEITKLTYDMATFHDTSPEEAFNAIQSGLLGITQPMRRYGVVLTDVMLNQEALAMGLEKTTEQMTEAEKIQLRYDVIMRQTATAQGNTLREADTYYSKNKAWGAAVKDLTIDIGKFSRAILSQLLPGFTKGIRGISNWINTNKEAVINAGLVITAIIGVVGALALLAGGIAITSMVFKGIISLVTLLTSGLGLVAVAVGLVSVAWKKDWFGIRTYFMEEIAPAIIEKLKDLTATLDAVTTGARNIWSAISEWKDRVVTWTVNLVKGTMAAVADWISKRVSWLVNLAKGTASAIGDWIGRVVTWLVNLAKGTASAIGDWLNKRVPWLVDLVKGTAVAVGDWVGRVITWAVNLVKGAWNAVSDWVGRRISWLVNLAKGAASAVADWVGRAVSWTVNLVKGAATAVAGWVDRVITWFVELKPVVAAKSFMEQVFGKKVPEDEVTKKAVTLAMEMGIKPELLINDPEAMAEIRKQLETPEWLRNMQETVDSMTPETLEVVADIGLRVLAGTITWAVTRTLGNILGGLATAMSGAGWKWLQAIAATDLGLAMTIAVPGLAFALTPQIVEWIFGPAPEERVSFEEAPGAKAYEEFKRSLADRFDWLTLEEGRLRIDLGEVWIDFKIRIGEIINLTEWGRRLRDLIAPPEEEVADGYQRVMNAVDEMDWNKTPKQIEESWGEVTESVEEAIDALESLDSLLDAIYRAEGGKRARVAYGMTSFADPDGEVTESVIDFKIRIGEIINLTEWGRRLRDLIAPPEEEVADGYQRVMNAVDEMDWNKTPKQIEESWGEVTESVEEAIDALESLDSLLDAIYRAEGGKRARVAYGMTSFADPDPEANKPANSFYSRSRQELFKRVSVGIAEGSEDYYRIAANVSAEGYWNSFKKKFPEIGNRTFSELSQEMQQAFVMHIGKSYAPIFDELGKRIEGNENWIPNVLKIMGLTEGLDSVLAEMERLGYDSIQEFVNGITSALDELAPETAAEVMDFLTRAKLVYDAWENDLMMQRFGSDSIVHFGKGMTKEMDKLSAELGPIFGKQLEETVKGDPLRSALSGVELELPPELQETAKRAGEGVMKGVGKGAASKLQEIVNSLTWLFTEGFDKALSKLPEEWQQVIREIREQALASIEQTQEVADSLTKYLDPAQYKINQVEEAAKRMTQSLAQGLAEAAVQGKNLFDVLDNFIRMLAAKIIENKIIMPLLGQIGLTDMLLQLPVFHTGGVVGPYGNMGLNSDERIIKAQVGETVLTKEQREGLEDALSGRQNVNLNIYAMDAKSFLDFAHRNPEAITSVVIGDIAKNGPTRGAIRTALA